MTARGFPLRGRPSGDPDSGEAASLTWCELNFTDAARTPIPETGILDIDRVNRTLGAIQALHDPGDPLGRVTVRDALSGVCAPARATSLPQWRGRRPSRR